MAKINPKNLSWKAPTTNTDGTPIEYELNYELGVVGTDGSVTPKLVVVGSLRETNDYVAQIADMGFTKGTYKVALRALAADNPTRASKWSASVEFTISDEIPNPPLDLAVS